MTTTITFSESDQSFLGKTDENTIFFDVVDNPVLVDPSTVAETNDDIEYNNNTSTDSKSGALVVPTNIPIGTIVNGVSIDESIGVIDSVLSLTHVADGEVEVHIGADGWGEKKFSYTMESTAAQSAADPTGYASGTVGAHLYSQIATLIGAASWSKSITNFWQTNNGDADNPDAVMNPSFFAAALDFSGISAIRHSKLSDVFPITAVSDRHAIVSKHVRPAVGEGVVWKLSGGSYFEAIVSAVTSVTKETTDNNGDPVTAAPDLALVYFDRALTGVTQYQTLPADFFSGYMPSTYYLNYSYPVCMGQIPVLRKAMHYADGSSGSAMQIDFFNYNGYNTDIPTHHDSGFITQSAFWDDHTIVADAGLADWGAQAIPGDSGGPSFLLINDELILFTTQWAVTGSSSIDKYVTEINAIMTAQAGSAYALTHPDLSGFTSY